MAINLSTHRLPQPVKKRKTASYINKITIGETYSAVAHQSGFVFYGLRNEQW